MPKGQKAIEWTPENDARLMLTILAVENVHPNCEAVATAFGGGVNAMTISNRLSRLRKKATDEGFMPKANAVTSAKVRKDKKVEAGKKGGLLARGSEVETPTEDSDTPPKHQKVLTGRITKTHHQPTTKLAKDTLKILNDIDTEPGSDTLYAAKEAVGESEIYNQEDSVGSIKVEDE